jgi:hypothetical protein
MNDGVQKALEQDDGRKAVDDGFPFVTRNAGSAQGALGFAAGPALVPEFHGQAGFVFQFAGEITGVSALAAGLAAHVNWIADQDQFYIRLDREPAQGFDVVSAPFALHGFQSLSREAELIAEGEAYSFLAEVECQNAARFIYSFVQSFGHDSIVLSRLALKSPVESLAMNQKATLGLVLASGLLGGVLTRNFPESVVHAQSQTTAETKLYLTYTFTARGHGVMLAADRIVGDKFGIYMEGNVEIKLRPSSPDQDVMVLHADEADYVRRTDEIVPSGNVRVTFETPK